MSANRIYLVCAKHTSIEDAFCIGERADGEGQYTAPSNKRMDDWYAKHVSCGRGCDHFVLAYNRPQDWDAPKPAENTTAGAVRMALATESVQ